MKRVDMLVLGVAVALLAAGCQNTQTRAVEGGVIGGVLGAAAGGIIGHQSGHGAEGAGIGAAAGVLGGAIIGSQIRKPGQEQAAAGANQPAQSASANQMAIRQIVDLTRQGVNENVIVDKIRLSNSKYNLTADDIAYLRENGVTQKVIDAMQGK